MSDTIKWAIIAALLGGSNIGTYVVGAKPEIKNATETQAAAEILSVELKACYSRLETCYENCK